MNAMSNFNKNLGFNLIQIKKELKKLPQTTEVWENDDNEPEWSMPIVELPNYFISLEQLAYGMTADMWGYLSICYISGYGYGVYEHVFSNALMCSLQEESKLLKFYSLSQKKVLHHCRKIYSKKKFNFPKNYRADYLI